MCVTDRHMTLAVKIASNPNTTNQPTNQLKLSLWADGKILVSLFHMYGGGVEGGEKGG